MLTRAAAPLPPPAEIFGRLAGARGLLLAVSGGPDSMALLALADRWRDETAIPISVATVDHGLRPGARREAEAVAAVCAARGLEHAILEWRGPKPATGLPAAAREARYALLAERARSIGADTIVTAHHADDQAETVLMRLTRGSGPAGLAGMAALAPAPGAGGIWLARPLLSFSKADLVAHCRAEGLPFFDDPTNSDEAYRRPQLRRLAATLAQEGLDRNALARLAARAARAEAALAPLIAAQLDALPARREPGQFEVAASELGALSEEALIRLLFREIARINPGSAPRLEQAENVAARLRQGGPVAATLGGVAIRLGAKRLIMKPQPPRRP